MVFIIFDPFDGMEPTSKVVLPRVTDDVGCSEDPDKEFDNVVFPLLMPLRETVTLFALGTANVPVSKWEPCLSYQELKFL